MADIIRALEGGLLGDVELGGFSVYQGQDSSLFLIDRSG